MRVGDSAQRDGREGLLHENLTRNTRAIYWQNFTLAAPGAYLDHIYWCLAIRGEWEVGGGGLTLQSPYSTSCKPVKMDWDQNPMQMHHFFLA